MAVGLLFPIIVVNPFVPGNGVFYGIGFFQKQKKKPVTLPKKKECRCNQKFGQRRESIAGIHLQPACRNQAGKLTLNHTVY